MDPHRETFDVEYYLADYHGTRTVVATDADTACRKVRVQCRRETSLAMYSDGYRLVGERHWRNLDAR